MKEIYGDREELREGEFKKAMKDNSIWITDSS